MTIPLGKITILIGAGIVGSVLAKEGRLPYVSDFVSGAFKIARKRMSRDDSSSSRSKPRNDSLLAQVKSLQQELQMLASNHPMTIVTTGGRGGRKYGIIILVVVVGYGIVWMKGWKLPDMMFATKRSLSDACTSVARQLEIVYSSIAATKRNLSSRMDHVDKSLDECVDLTADTQEKVSELRGKSDTFGRDIKSVHHAVQTLETKLWSFEEKQELTNEGVKRLCNYAWNLENRRATERIQASPSSSSRPALELPATTPSSRNQTLPLGFSPEAVSSSESNGSSDQAIPSSSSRPAHELPATTPSSRNRSLPLGFSPEALSSSESNASSNQVIPSSSSRPALELPPTKSPSSRQNRSLPLGFSPEVLSSSESNASSSNQVQRQSLQNGVSDPGLLGRTMDANASWRSSLDTTSNGSSTSDSSRSEAGNSGLSGLSGLGFLTRTRSAMSAVFRQARPSVQS